MRTVARQAETGRMEAGKVVRGTTEDQLGGGADGRGIGEVGSPGSELGAQLLSRLPWSEGRMLGAVVTDTSACFAYPQCPSLQP